MGDTHRVRIVLVEHEPRWTAATRVARRLLESGAGPSLVTVSRLDPRTDWQAPEPPAVVGIDVASLGWGTALQRLAVLCEAPGLVPVAMLPRCGEVGETAPPTAELALCEAGAAMVLRDTLEASRLLNLALRVGRAEGGRSSLCAGPQAILQCLPWG
ncbi:hypothetical protein Mal64_36920 [Pseudobythopirellula maris]|uniref:Uncharacterized protein n=1 Tax=Pseudobythopirellula maris TaxID=2527991 RepID=A0A5C5ZHM7_9BACT|nr:hypothetical protein [Pseudobythopirellula maris]TWT86862.1 hypothetical protein Mal64_36920 [Pseudobythopirellula maris]